MVLAVLTWPDVAQTGVLASVFVFMTWMTQYRVTNKSCCNQKAENDLELLDE